VVELGIPFWTSRQLTKRGALDDLGLECVGAGLLRRLIPVVVQTTDNAGYYAFYPYLLATALDRYEGQQVWGMTILEYWIPAEELDGTSPPASSAPTPSRSTALGLDPAHLLDQAYAVGR
jgi:hypothetical protein